MIIIIVICFVIAAFIAKKYSRKAQPVKAGDQVRLRTKYKTDFPQLPKSYPVRIEQIKDEQARVSFFSSNGKEILEQLVPTHVLVKVDMD